MIYDVKNLKITKDGDTYNIDIAEESPVMTGATSSTVGTSGLVPAPAAGDQDKVLTGAGTWSSSDECEVSGDVVSFETFESKAKKLVVNVDPVQDLHGYDSPWPAGGGKNLIPYPYTSPAGEYNGITFTINNDGTVNVSGASTGTVYFNLRSSTQGQKFTLKAGSYIVNGSYGDAIIVISKASNNTAIGSTNINNGLFSIAEDTEAFAFIQILTGITINGTIKPMIRLSSVSDATFAPYSNECPISGWDSANVTGTGKNLLDITDVEFEGWYNADGTKELSNSYNCYLVSVKPETTYTISGNFAGIITYWDSGLNFISGTNQGSGASKTFTTPSNCSYIRRSILKTNIDGTQMLELGSTASAYTPYSGSTAEYEFPQAAKPVYGGTLTIHQDGSGELVVKRWYKKVTWGEGGQATSPTDGFIRKRYEMGISNKYPSTIPQICSVAPYAAAFNQFYLHFYVNDDSNAFVFLPENTPSDLEIEISGELATPVTYQLTNQQVLSLLKGQNNVWADCGSLDLTYYRTETAYQVSLNTANISGKADKVASATSGNFAGLDANGNLTDSGYKSDDYLERFYENYYGFEEKTWSGLTSFSGSNIWTDGDNIYYSYVSTQYVLDKTTSAWTSKAWSGLAYFNGSEIWADDENIYYSSGTKQYVLDKSTSAWIPKTWSGGLTSFSGSKIWTDGENIYYSSWYYNQSGVKVRNNYVLDKATSTWTSKTWSGLYDILGDDIWTDGENIYYSYDSTQYVLDKSTSTWSEKTWNGLTSLNGSEIWTDGENIYYSYDSTQYVLDKSTSTWSEKTWNGLTNFSGSSIWTDGENIYYSSTSNQYIFNNETGTLLFVGKNGEFKRKTLNSLVSEIPLPGIMAGATVSTDGASGLVPAPASGDNAKYLKGDGTWADPTPNNMWGATSSSNGRNGLVPAPFAGDQSKVLRGDGMWGCAGLLMAGTAFSIPSAGDSVTYIMSGMKATCRLIQWNFSVSAENNPPASLEWTTANGMFTITNNGGDTDETIQPVFADTFSMAIDEYIEEGE